MPKISNKSATSIDRVVGKNIRVHRLAAGRTQEELGAQLSVTFQQIQKYEKGASRVGSGRLYQIAEILEVPVKMFFAGGTQQKDSRSSSPFDLFTDPLTMQMAREFGKMADSKTRRAILAVVENLVSMERPTAANGLGPAALCYPDARR